MIKVDTDSVINMINDCAAQFDVINNSLATMNTNLKHIKSLWSGCDANSSSASVAFEIEKLTEVATTLAGYITNSGLSMDKYNNTDKMTF